MEHLSAAQVAQQQRPLPRPPQSLLAPLTRLRGQRAEMGATAQILLVVLAAVVGVHRQIPPPIIMEQVDRKCKRHCVWWQG